VIQDIRQTFRSLRRHPGFASTAVLSLAIGIGANASLFSVFNSLLLNPLAYRDQDRLVILWNRSPGLGISEDWFSTAQYFDIRNGHSGFEELAIAFGSNMNLTGDGEPERVAYIQASSNLLPMLGASAASGRLFLPEDDITGRAATVLLSHGMWARRYGADPGMIGRKITLNGLPYEVVGILPQSFSLPREVLPTLYGSAEAEIFLPLPLAASAEQTRNREDFNIVGKLKRGVTIRRAQSEMDLLTAGLRRDHPDVYPPNGGLTFSVVPLLEQVVGNVRRPLYILLAAVGIVMLVVCANTANLSLARALARQKEIAVRTALGATRIRIIRQLLTESLILALLGGTAAMLVSAWSLDGIRILGPGSIPRLSDIRVDARVLAFTLLISLSAGVVFGLAPALRVSRPDLIATLKEAGRDSSGANAIWGRGWNMRKLLVVAELALSVVLLIGAGLLIRSFAILQDVHPGFESRNLLTLELRLSGQKYAEPQMVLATYRQLREKIESLPGVVVAGATTALPLSQTLAWTPISIEGRTPQPGERFINTDERIVGGRYFEAMEIPLLHGRSFDDKDTQNSIPVAIVDGKMAREFWPDQNPIGKRIRHGGTNSDAPWITIVGVVGQVKHDALDSDPRIVVYLPQTQYPTRGMTLTIRTRVEPAALAVAVKKVVHDIDPDLPAYRVQTMQRYVEQSLARRRFSMLLLALFAGLALTVACFGIYGVMAYLVSQGAREIGIRMAMGATQAGILRLVVREGMVLALSGAGIGLAGAYVLTRFMRSLLFEVTPTDRLTFGLVPAMLILSALAACYIPARRAARIDPMASLRCE